MWQAQHSQIPEYTTVVPRTGYLLLELTRMALVVLHDQILATLPHFAVGITNPQSEWRKLKVKPPHPLLHPK
jgi:hypothetical protein